MTKPTPEDIIEFELLHAEGHMPKAATPGRVVKALTDAGYIIAPATATPQMLKAGIAAFENADYDGDMMLEFADVWAAMTKDTGS